MRSDRFCKAVHPSCPWCLAHGGSQQAISPASWCSCCPHRADQETDSGGVPKHVQVHIVNQGQSLKPPPCRSVWEEPRPLELALAWALHLKGPFSACSSQAPAHRMTRLRGQEEVQADPEASMPTSRPMGMERTWT